MKPYGTLKLVWEFLEHNPQQPDYPPEDMLLALYWGMQVDARTRDDFKSILDCLHGFLSGDNATTEVDQIKAVVIGSREKVITALTGIFAYLERKSVGCQSGEQNQFRQDLGKPLVIVSANLRTRYAGRINSYLDGVAESWAGNEGQRALSLEEYDHALREESQIMALVPEAPNPAAVGKRFCIVARKHLRWNTRIVRKAFSLEREGYDVVVLCLTGPCAELQALTPRTLYIGMLDDSVAAIASSVKPEKGTVPKKRHIPGLHRLKLMLQHMGAVFYHLWRAAYGVLKLLIGPMLSSRKKRQSKALLQLLNSWKMNYNFAKFILGAVQFKVDAVEAHDTYSLMAAQSLIKHRGGAFIYDAVEIPDDRSGAHMSALPEWACRLSSNLEAKTIRDAKLTFTVSNGLRDWTAERYGLGNIQLLRNCRFYMPPFRDSRIREDLGLAEHERVALYITSFYANQGIEELIECSKLLPEHIHIAIMGPRMNKKYEAKVNELEASLEGPKRLHLLPPRPPSDLLLYAGGADIGIIARQNTCINNYYSLPNRILEMIMARLPLACTSLKDMSDLVKAYGVGMVFDETDPKNIAETVQAMLKPERLAEFRERVEQAAKELCWERESQTLVQHVNELVLGASR